jgi:ribosomal protein S21
MIHPEIQFQTGKGDEVNNIDKLLKRFKNKVESSKILTRVRENRYFKKKSLVRRERKKKLNFKNNLKFSKLKSI